MLAHECSGRGNHPIATKASCTIGDNRQPDPETWSGEKPHKVPTSQVWYRTGRQWIIVYRRPCQTSGFHARCSYRIRAVLRRYRCSTTDSLHISSARSDHLSETYRSTFVTSAVYTTLGG
ncbi:hypothetical protein D915_006947 [Fasciola hepatica]|uniref:Uncharacterized protein n=1 Tax=Fasciola hepatica TaxID=6192 RepID=A0A4E0RYY8_FASHE|nr:hypothetical protein D915_006947 [Fasciola hepatica]